MPEAFTNSFIFRLFWSHQTIHFLQGPGYEPIAEGLGLPAPTYTAFEMAKVKQVFVKTGSFAGHLVQSAADIKL